MVKRSFAFLIVAIVMASAVQSTSATVFDFRNLTLGPSPQIAILTLDGIRLTLGPGSGSLVSTPTRFGIDRLNTNDIPDLIDGDTLGFLVSPLDDSKRVVLDSIWVSEFDATDSGSFQLKGVPPINVSILNNGLNSYGGLPISSGGSNFLAGGGTGDNPGFSLDAMEFHIVPEPASIAILASSLPLGIGWLLYRRRIA